MASEKKVIVTQKRSSIGMTQRQKDTLACLGLGRIGKSAEHNLAPSTLGMLRKVSNVVSVREV